MINLQKMLTGEGGQACILIVISQLRKKVPHFFGVTFTF